MEKNAEQYFESGIAYFKKRSFLDASSCFTKSHELAPKRVSILLNLLLTEIELNQFQKAKITADKVLTLDEYNYDAIVCHAIIAKEMGELDLAHSQLNQAIKIDSDASSAWINLGVVLNMMGKKNEAISAFDQALIQEPNNLDALKNKAIILLGQKQYEQALEAFKYFLSIHDSDKELLLTIYDILIKLKRFKEAAIIRKETYGIIRFDFEHGYSFH
jgi:tetratricopeptide (TPR) repeat protein